MADGGYMSTSDVEDDDEHDDDADDAEVGEACGLANTATYRSIIVKRVLSTQVEKLDKQQCHKIVSHLLCHQQPAFTCHHRQREFQQFGEFRFGQEAWLDHTQASTAIPC